MDFATIIRKSGQYYRENTAVLFEGRTLTYGGLLERASRLANALASFGLAPGDRVAVLADNRFETVEISVACALGNTPVATLYTYYSNDTNLFLLEHIDARALIVDEALYPALAGILPKLRNLTAVVVLGDGPPPAGAHGYDELLARSPAEVPQVPVSGDDVHIIRFSSGTTGRPKGIYHSVDRWLAYSSEWRWMTPRLTERDTYVVAVSLAHLGVAYLWGMLAVGARIIPMRRFDAAEFGDLVETHRATYTAMVPTMIQKVLDTPEAARRDYSTLRCLTYAGSPIAEKTLRRAIDLFGPCLHQMYAQSEVAPVTMLLPHEHRLDGGERNQRHLRSVGRPSAHVKLTVVDDEGRPVPQGEIGEIAAWSPGRMSGVWGDPTATAARLLPDGSVLTRDMGYVDEDGYVFLKDRKDDMIISGGYNIWPVELEAVLLSHPGVRAACVIGVPHDVWGETPKAVVVRASGAEVTEEDLIALTGDRLGRVKRVTSVDFVDTLPVSGAGKILRSEIRGPFWAGRDSLVGGV
ncbi:class I adenylate-forming enzyme family protein [Streptomyces sp. NPDC085927]|uniref:class I adenylate-forming enzyme family protein n=1 Tax=Streptomyces sp. NPDC085927 TaxID=3365738 RepID=UPI0037CE7314